MLCMYFPQKQMERIIFFQNIPYAIISYVHDIHSTCSNKFDNIFPLLSPGVYAEFPQELTIN